MAALTLAELEEIAKTRRLTKAERSRKSKLLNPERVNAARQKMREANREKLAAEARAYYHSQTPEQRQERARACRARRLAKDPDFERRHIREWREAHPDYNKDYVARNRHIIQAQGRRRRAKEYGAEGSHTQYELDMLMVRQANMCANPYCRADLRTVKVDLDHKLALSCGGSDDITNLQYLCASCNRRKNKLTMSDWLEREEKRAARALDRTAKQGA